jgi:hypothetical protein
MTRGNFEPGNKGNAPNFTGGTGGLIPLPREVARRGLLTHPMIFINETLSRINPCYVPSGQANDQMASNPALDEMLTTLRGVWNPKT